MYLQIAHRSPRMIAAMNCVSTIVSTSTFASSNSRAKCLFNVASQIGLPSLPMMRRQTRSCDIPHATRSLTTARSSSVGTNGGLPTFLLEGSLFSLPLLFFMPRSLVFSHGGRSCLGLAVSGGRLRFFSVGPASGHSRRPRQRDASFPQAQAACRPCLLRCAPADH